VAATSHPRLESIPPALVWALTLAFTGIDAAWSQAAAQQVSQAAATSGSRPGRIRIGAFYLNPWFRISSIGLDSNVFYTAEDHQPDISASGGPGLDLILPIKSASRFYANGYLDYLYFLRTESQRRLRWGAASGLTLNGQRTNLVAEESYSTSFARPSFEVDERIDQQTEQTTGDLKRRLFWRIGVTLGGSRARSKTDAGQEFLGTDLSKTLTRDDYRARFGLTYAVTIKTSFVVEGERQWSRFPNDPVRDATWDRLAAGFRTDATALISGELMAGVRYYRPDLGAPSETRSTYVGVNATWNVTPKTKFPFLYVRDRAYSAFSTSGTPTVHTETMGLGLDKELRQRLDLELRARLTRFVTDGEITVEIPDQGPVTAVREDRAWEYGADLGYLFGPNIRIGIAASYTDRNSTISYFGIEGLLFGVTVRYTPN
jgi:hypothetical protein